MASAEKASLVCSRPNRYRRLPRNQPEPRVAGNGDAAGDIDGIVAAKLWTVNFGMGDKRRPIALVMKAPDRAGLRSLVILLTNHRAGIDEIADGVEPLDRQSSVTVHDHPLGGGGRRRRSAKARSPDLPAARRSGLFRREMPILSPTRFLSCRRAVIVDTDNIRVGGTLDATYGACPLASG